MNKDKLILIIAGEVSGDLYGSQLVSAILAQDHKFKFIGIGGEKMAAAGVNIIENANKLAVVGATEIIWHFMAIYKAFNKIKNIILHNPPDLLILIDYPGFNLRLAKIAKLAGIKVFYYISPQIWAWRKKRIEVIRKYVDKMVVIFPFEKNFYKEAGIEVAFVGHPLVNNVKANMSSLTARNLWHIDVALPLIGILPGSRHGEIKRLLPLLLATILWLLKQNPQLQFILPIAPNFKISDIISHINRFSAKKVNLESQSLEYCKIKDINLAIVKGYTYDAIAACDAIVAASGTVTLEAALLGVPMAIVYKVSPLSYLLAKALVKIPYIGLCNIIADKMLVKEFIQHMATPTSIGKEVEKILYDDAYRQNMQHELEKIKVELGEGGGIMQVANLIINMCNL